MEKQKTSPSFNLNRSALWVFDTSKPQPTAPACSFLLFPRRTRTLTLATCSGFLCSAPPCSRKPQGAPPDSVITTSSTTMAFAASVVLFVQSVQLGPQQYCAMFDAGPLSEGFLAFFSPAKNVQPSAGVDTHTHMHTHAHAGTHTPGLPRALLRSRY